ncbi:histidine kinase [Cellulosimicrobium sp. E-16]|uniref:histidine kinase n=1 Tax=Cellulosimicrobium sp. E-16 TaxID=3404049 RepID=UPI003CF32683
MSSEQSPAPDGDAPDRSTAPDIATDSAPDAASDTAPDTVREAVPAASTETSGEASDEVEIESVVDPATVRRAPRYGAFFTVGVLLGTVLGLGIGGAWLQSPAADPVFKPGVYFTVIVVTCAALGAAVAGLWAVLADRRSLRGRR